MSPDLEKICSLLSTGSAELQCAAAMVVGELRPKDAGARRALVRALESGNDMVRTYAIEALTKIGAEEAVPHLIPLLGASPSVKARAMKVIAEAGREVVNALRERLKDADPEVRKGIVEALGRVTENDSTDLLVRALRDKDPAVPTQAAASFLARIGAMTPAQRKAAAKQVAEALKKGGAAVPCLQVLGALAEGSATGTLLAFSGPKHSVEARAAALRALSRLPLEAKAVLAKLIPLFDEAGEIATAALEVAGKLRVGRAEAKKVLKLIAHPSPAVRVAALRALGTLATPESAEALASALGGSDREISEAASASLRSNVAFAGPLVKLLETVSEQASAWKIADAVRAHKDALDSKARRSLLTKCLTLFEKREERYRLLFEILRTVGLDDLRKAILKRGRDLLSKKKFGEAEGWLRLLEPDDLAVPESMYALALARLKQRKNDPAVALFAQLLRRPEFPAVKLLEKDRGLLGAGDLLHLGFRFIEKQGAERDFGAEVMKLVVGRFGRAREAVVAKQKLKTQGLG